MPGRFEGLSDLEWRLFEDLFDEPLPKPQGGRPKAPARLVLNTMLYVLITGCRWADVPIGPQWAPRSTAHDRLRQWVEDGTLERIKQRLLGIAHEHGMIRWEYGAIDGSFSPWQGRG